MKELKYIKLYEAFESNILSKTVNFLSKDGSKKFLSEIKDLCQSADFPLSKLKDEWFKYLSYKKAINLKPEVSEKRKCEYESEWIDGEFCKNGRVKRTWGSGTRTVQCPKCNGTGISPDNLKDVVIKYWFDYNGNYIDKTASDGKGTKYNILSNFDTNKNNYEDDRHINTYEELIKLNGSVVYFHNFSGYDRVLSYVYVEDDNVYLVQSKINHGSKPNISLPTGLYTCLYIRSYIWSTYIRDSNNSSVNGLMLMKPKDPKNVPSISSEIYLDKRLSLRGNIVSLISNGNIYEDLKNAHFALILDINKVFNDKTSLSKLKSDRSDSKKGALAFETPENIKRANVDRYMDKIISNSNINKDDYKDFNNLKSIIIRMLGGRNVFFYIHYRSNINVLSRVNNILTSLHSLIKNNYYDEGDIKYHLENINYDVRSNVRSILDINKIINMSRDSVKSSEPIEIDLFNRIDEISNYIYNKILEIDIETIEDVEILLQDLRYIRSLTESSIVGLKDISNFFYYITSSSYYRSTIDYLDPNPSLRDSISKKLDNITKIVKRKF